MDPQMEGSPNQSNGQIHIDWNGWLELIGFEGDSDREIELTIEPAGKLAFLSVGTSHPDPGIRAAAIIAGISVGMGLLSIVIAVSQFFT